MSTKTTLASSGATSESALGVLQIKKEPQSDEIKEFAEHTMNELLGWYGFDGVDRMDLSTKTPRLLSSGSSNGCVMTQYDNDKIHSRSRTVNSLELEKTFRKRKNSSNYNKKDQNNSDKNSSPVVTGIATAMVGNESTTSDHDTRSSRDDDSKSPLSMVQSRCEEKIDLSICCWCRRPVSENAPEFLTTSDAPRYCSESCFAQSRRASFKKAKTCDWCKHVRHAVSYVDFQDGASQLQFCSDKCLNQYKMQIFCKETQAHLDMNPHLREQGLEAGTNGANLITPDLWLRNCRSRSVSPASTISVSPSPAELTIVPPVLPALSPTRASFSVANQSGVFPANKTAHKPMISVAPVSKLMSKNAHTLSSRSSLKINRRKRPLRSCVSNNANLTNQLPLNTNHKETPSVGSKPNNIHFKAINNSGIKQFASSSVQDLHMTMPPISPMLEQHNPNQCSTNIPPAYFATPTHHAPEQSPNSGTHPHGFSTAQRPPYLSNPRFFGFPGTFQPYIPNPLMQMNQFSQQDLGCMNSLIGASPPVTVMVPYPVILPLPIPIPVPLPIMDFYKAHGLLDKKEEKSKTEPPVLDTLKPEESQTSSRSQQCDKSKESSKVLDKEEQPIDYTKAKDMPVSQSGKNVFIEEDIETIHVNGASTVNDETPTIVDIVVDTEIITQSIEELDHNRNEELTNENEGNEIPFEDDNAKQNLPKFKITRLQTKRTLLQAREAAESSRPLRKRKRLIDCEFQTVLLKDDEALNDNVDLGT